MKKITFWFEFASTYSYLAAMRIELLAQASGLVVEWKPFLLGPIFAGQGLTDSPFNVFPIKGAYTWRDLERECIKYGFPVLQKPAVFPGNGMLAARVAERVKTPAMVALGAREASMTSVRFGYFTPAAALAKRTPSILGRSGKFAGARGDICVIMLLIQG